MRLRTHWPAIAVALYFLVWTEPNLHVGFSFDDVMNLYAAWVAPLVRLFTDIVTVWSAQSRPVGGLAYRAIYAVAGFHPLPFHAVCLALLVVNLGLQYRLYRSLPGAAAIAWIALLLGAFHACMRDLYANVGTLYDILCGTFYYAALLLYIRSRNSRVFTKTRAAALLLLVLLALGTKEMALSVPALLLLYEALFHPPEPKEGVRHWALANLWRIGPSALVCAASMLGRLLIHGTLTGHPGYTPVFTASRLLETTATYTRQAVGDTIPFTGPQALLFWAVCLGLALWSRSRLILFGLLSFTIGVLPLSFVAPRNGYVLYIPAFGLALAVAAAFLAVRERFAPRFAAPLTAALVCCIFVVDYSRGASLRGKVGVAGEGAIRTTAEHLPLLCPQIAPDARVLLIDSPFGEEVFVPTFTLGLLYHSKQLYAVNARAPATPDALSLPFDHRFVYKDGDIFEIKPEPAKPGPVVPATVRLLNLSRPGARDFYPGEAFQLSVTGAPDEAVFATATRDSVPLSSGAMGRTDQRGRFSVRGKFGAEHIGLWQEQWRVGPAAAPPLSFAVKHR